MYTLCRYGAVDDAGQFIRVEYCGTDCDGSDPAARGEPLRHVVRLLGVAGGAGTMQEGCILCGWCVFVDTMALSFA